MPVNAPPEYYKAEEKFKSAKTIEDKILALEEMIRLMPKHHGSEAALAQLKSRLAKLRKEQISKKGGRGKKVGIAKEGDAQICIIGFTQSGKSSLLNKITNANAVVSSHPYTTTKPAVGTMDYEGIKLQIIEIPSTFQPEHLSIVRSTDLLALVSKNKTESKKLENFLKENYIRILSINVNPLDDRKSIKEQIWSALDMIIVYTRAKGQVKTPMALKKNSTVRDFAERIHKDFVKNFRIARLYRSKKIMQVGLNYKLQAGDIVEIYAR